MNDDAATYTSMYNNDKLDFSLTFVDKPFYLCNGIGELDGYKAYITPGPTKKQLPYHISTQSIYDSNRTV